MTTTKKNATWPSAADAEIVALDTLALGPAPLRELGMFLEDWTPGVLAEAVDRLVARGLVAVGKHRRRFRLFRLTPKGEKAARVATKERRTRWPAPAMKQRPLPPRARDWRARIREAGELLRQAKRVEGGRRKALMARAHKLMACVMDSVLDQPVRQEIIWRALDPVRRMERRLIEAGHETCIGCAAMGKKPLRFTIVIPPEAARALEHLVLRAADKKLDKLPEKSSDGRLTWVHVDESDIVADALMDAERRRGTGPRGRRPPTSGTGVHLDSDPIASELLRMHRRSRRS